MNNNKIIIILLLVFSLKVELVAQFRSLDEIRLQTDINQSFSKHYSRLKKNRFSFALPQKYEQADIASNRSSKANWVKTGGILFLQAEGQQQVIGIWDAGTPLVSHQEFGNRIIPSDTAQSLTSNAHATQVAGIGIGNGLNPQAIGVASQAYMHCYDWTNDVSELAHAAQNGIAITVHPYVESTGWYYNWFNDNRWVWYADTTASSTENAAFGFYSEHAQYMDEIAYASPYLIIVRAAGNQRDRGPASQPVEHWIPYYDSEQEQWGWKLSTTIRERNGSTSGFESIAHASVAKNSIVVANVYPVTNPDNPADIIIAANSSFGPTDDGRIKPDLSAVGQNVFMPTNSSSNAYSTSGGTSFSAGLVAGAVATLRDEYIRLRNTEPLSSTIKAVLLHTASEAGNHPGPDYTVGWGLLNLEKAVRYIRTATAGNRYIMLKDSLLTQGNTVEIEFTKTTSKPIKVTIYWNDPASTPNSQRLNPTESSLIHDLDIRLIDSEQTTYYPWKLDRNNPAAPAQQADNTVDNIEQIVANPAISLLRIVISHKNSLIAAQPFSLILTEGEPNSQFTLSGTAGWRLLALPTLTTLPSYANTTHIQGIPRLNSYEQFQPNFFHQFQNSNWIYPDNAMTTLNRGSGFIHYFYDNTLTPNSDLPLLISANGSIDTTNVKVNLVNESGFNMVGNPFATSLQFSQISTTSGTLLDIGWIWNPELGWTSISRTNQDVIEAFSGFFIETIQADSLLIPFSARINTNQKRPTKTIQTTTFQISEKNGQFFNPMDNGVRIVVANSNNDSLFFTTKKPRPLTSSFTSLVLLADSNITSEEYYQLVTDSTQNEKYYILRIISDVQANFTLSEINTQTLIEWSLFDNGEKLNETGKSNNNRVRIVSTINAQKNKFGYFQKDIKIIGQQKLLVTRIENKDITFPVKSISVRIFPNPLNPTSIFEIDLPKTQFVQISVFDATGKHITTVFNGVLQEGNHRLQLNASSWSSGVYFVQAKTDSEVIFKTISLIK